MRSANGIIDPQPLDLRGSFAFTADCYFEMAFDVGFRFIGTVVGRGDEVLFLETDPGTTFVVTATRMVDSRLDIARHRPTASRRAQLNRR